MGELLHAFFALRHWLTRGRKELAEFHQRIEAEGGTVVAARRVGMFLRSPFGGLRRYPQYYRFDVRYPGRMGSWYIAASEGVPAGEWVWCDGEGRTELPVSRTDARVDNSVLALGFFIGTLIGWCLLAGIIGVLLWWYL